jgi:light-regulated signal transduction histidine kinase (bacteriophytochrome)
MTTITHTTTAAPVISLDPSIDLLVDELGQLQDQAAALADQIDSLKTTIKAQGAGRYLGSRWQSVVTAPSESDRINWEAVAMHFQPSRQLLTAHTKTVVNVPRITTTIQKGKA